MAPNLGVPMAFRAERLTFAAAEDGDRGRSDIPAELDQGAPDIIDTSAGAPSGDDREARGFGTMSWRPHGIRLRFQTVRFGSATNSPHSANGSNSHNRLISLVEPRGVEPLTS
jgi:hypothetical protein